MENINRQYRRLAREGRTDHANHLKQEMQDANNRWDKLQQCVSAMTLQLKQSSSLHEDFTSVRDSLYTWLNDVDMQLTNIEHLSSMDTPTKMAETMVGNLYHGSINCYTLIVKFQYESKLITEKI